MSGHLNFRNLGANKGRKAEYVGVAVNGIVYSTKTFVGHRFIVYSQERKDYVGMVKSYPTVAACEDRVRKYWRQGWETAFWMPAYVMDPLGCFPAIVTEDLCAVWDKTNADVTKIRGFFFGSSA